MVALAASMFDLTGAATDPATLREVLLLALGAVVTGLLLYGLRKQERS